MEEPRSHYQLSFTARQALFLFLGLLAGLGVAFFLGLMTGLSGREPGGATVASGAPSTPTPETLEFPRAERGVSPPRAGSRAPGATLLPTAPAASSPATFPGPTPSPGIQLFDDAPARRPAPGAPDSGRTSPAAPGPASPPAPSGAFWVQALSATSEREADARRDRLTAHGFSAAVVPGPGPHGRVYRVRVGPFRTREDAERTASRLKTTEKLEPWIVPPGK